MTDHHPITPPPSELVQQWEEDWLYTAARAAQWGADQELEACTAWLRRASYGHAPDLASNLRAARRPKPPSLKKQALEALSEMEDECLMVTHSATIRKALEALPDD